MPGRLGDDPLSRKRSPSAKDAPSARPGLPVQQTSHNDVFFHRRIEGLRPRPEDSPDKQLSGLGEATSTDERPEITEVADIVRTAKAAKSTQGAEQLARPVPMDESIHPQAVEQVERTEQTLPTVSEPVAAFEPPPPVTQEPPAPASSQAEPEPQKSEGFLKRLFGRFGK